MRAFDDGHFNRWLVRHGIVLYSNYFAQQCRNASDYVYHRNHYTREFRHFAINLALNSPIPHAWCWFCHSFGRFNCFLIHILQQRSENGVQLPSFLRSSARACQSSMSAKVAHQPYANIRGVNSMQQSKHHVAKIGKLKRAQKTKIAYFEIEIRPNVRNVPLDLNRFVPYRVPVDLDEDYFADSSPCSSPIAESDFIPARTLWEPAPDGNKQANKK